LFFIKFDALCTANHFIEGSFSNKGSLMRDNISDERVDRKARYRQNESHPIVNQVITNASARMKMKGCKGTTVSAFKTMHDVQEFIRGHDRKLRSGYQPEDFTREKGCPTNRSHRDSYSGQITARDRAKGRETVRAQTDWAAGAGRGDAGDEFWDDLAATTENPHLQKFKEDLEKETHAASAEGRCEKVLSRLLLKKTWTGSGSYTTRSEFPWQWHVDNMLPRFSNTMKTWHALRPEGIVVTSYLSGYRIRRMGARGFRK
jgi:hypothetical protein